MTNSLRGEFITTLGGECQVFDTTLGTIARIEEACGCRSIMEIVGTVVTGRRAADQMPLITAALQAAGRAAPDAQALAARATVPEAEAFILALMGALGFKLAREGEGGGADDAPLAGSGAGAAGVSSPSAA